ncbi:dTDP-4-dehydrorhamnose reductase [Humibacillus xanthopallidus]|uniref:dTDP-4-dehydrorhamnose reductase n=1 Tax=Humibacillus xanthopallidus TaxID=412689 RepID=A0A543PXL4_9MICO|nr:dTDP-4-dehydrorhamnose reductase [Humibacillus xanthopallidus]TQN48790.1 dTDP-4-dehydrorhamnose reductase [Humibacillus xanthopallidus]
MTSAASDSARGAAAEPLRVLVTGAGGMLAHDLVPRLRAAGHQVTAFSRADLDVTDPAECIAGVAGHDLVINAAAHTAVDAAETEEGVAFSVNAVGAANLARACTHAGARMVQISTDYVFDGMATEPYAVDHPIAPHSAYGRTKAAGEWAVQALCADHWIVRTAWLYGHGGPNFVSTMLRLAGERETLSVVDDQRGQPTSTVDLADLLLRLVEADAPSGTYHGTSSGETTWWGFARAVFEESGLDPERVQPTTTDAFPRPAPRPAYSVLSHSSLVTATVTPIGDWRSGLSAHLQHIKGGQPRT